MAKAWSIGLVCLFVLCSAVFGDEDFERMLEMYAKSGSANPAQRLREYEELQKMRRERGDRHLPSGSRFDFARESFRQVRTNAPGTDANGCAWTSAGPTNLNGRVISIAIDPTDNQRIYAATVGGLWRSSTAGRRWERVSDDLMASRFGAVEVNPGAPNEILAAMGDPNMGDAGDGMYRSTSYGAPGTWSKVTNVFDNRIVYRIRIDPDPPNNVYVAASNGVWLGEHDAGGIKFTQDKLGNLDASTHDIAVDFSSMPRTIYAGVRKEKGGIFRGIHKWNGSMWTKKDTGIDTTDSEAISIALSKSNPSILYAKVAQSSDGSLVGLYKTTTAGEKPGGGMDAWDKLPLGEPNCGLPDEWGWYNTMLEVDPTDPDRVYAGGTHMWMSTTGGDCWKRISLGKDPSYPHESHVDVHTLAFDPVNPKIICIGNDGGIDRSTDISQPVWHWEDVSHGMIISMFYYMTSNRLYPTLLAGGLQDNGAAITFGNRTWYNPGGCDGYDVGSDAGNPDTLYANCNQGLYELANPVPGTEGGPVFWPVGLGATTIAWDTPVPLRPPLITDMVTPKAALAGGGTDCGAKTILRTIDNVKFEDTNPNFPPGGAAVELASAPWSEFKTWLAAVAYKPPTDPSCNFNGMTFNSYVTRTDDGGEKWTTVTGLPTAYTPSSLAFDPNDASRSYVTYKSGSSGKVYMSSGGAYEPIGSALPFNVGVRRLVVDPFDSNVLYVGTAVGVFRGVVDPFAIPPTATWDPFDEGLPDGMEINDIWVDAKTGILTIGSFGFGAFRRDIRKKVKCSPRMLVVRDTVYDDGREPSASGIPDAEHPILVDYPFYRPDDTVAGKASWWTSRDIRIDVPSIDPPANQIENADSVEFELCPTSVANCPPGSMLDSAPKGHTDARVYVQVTNRGVEAVAKTRVIALWNTAGAAFDKLPATFWTKTFPANGECGSLDPGTGWQLVDPVTPCRTIATVTPDMPELARFDWNVPLAADGGATMFTVVESPDDLLDPSIRDQNKLAPSEIVPGSRHIALRGLRIIDLGVRVPFLWPLDLLHLPEEMSEVEVVVSKVDLRDSVRIALPAGLTARAGLGSVRQTRVTEEELVRRIESMGLDPDNAWELSGDEASLFVDLRPGQRVTTAVIATPADTNATSRVSIVERSRGKVVGGSVMLLRPKR